MEETNNILQQPTFIEWFKAEENAFYDTPHEKLAKALFQSGRVHTPYYDKLFTYERQYINQQANHLNDF